MAIKEKNLISIAKGGTKKKSTGKRKKVVKKRVVKQNITNKVIEKVVEKMLTPTELRDKKAKDTVNKLFNSNEQAVAGFVAKILKVVASLSIPVGKLIVPALPVTAEPTGELSASSRN